MTHDTVQLIVATAVALLGIITPVAMAVGSRLRVTMTEQFQVLTKNIDALKEQHNVQALQINTILQGDIRELRGRVVGLEDRLRTIETGEGTWMGVLRNRTHDLANEVNTLALDLDRVKRHAGVPPLAHGDRP
jgi:hypothetical protein